MSEPDPPAAVHRPPDEAPAPDRRRESERRPPPPVGGPALTLNAWLRWDVVRRVLADLADDTPAALPRGSAPRSVLEIGCGQGAVGARLAACYDYVGYEPDPASAARARTRLDGRGRVVEASLPARPDRAFDLVCAFEVLEHMEDDAAALAAWAGWLNPGGALLLSVPADPARFGPADDAVGHFRRYDRDTLTRLLTDAGLIEPRLWSYGFPLGYLLDAARHRLAERWQPAARSPVRSRPGREPGEPEQGGREPGGPSRAERTAASGRWGQPSDVLAPATRLATLPFRLAQRPFIGSRLGTGIIAAGRRPG